jgi:hypothetical protein
MHLRRGKADLRSWHSLTLTLLATGCAHVAPPPSAPPSADAAIARMRETFACGAGVQAGAKFDQFGKEGRLRGEVMLFAIRPADLRMDIVSPFGVTLATLTADGRRFALSDLREKRFLTGRASACNIARLTSVAVPPSAFVGLLHGEAPVLRHAPEGAAIAWSPRGYWVLSIAGTNDAREEIHLAPRPEDWQRPWAEQRMRVLDVEVEQQQFVLYHAELSDHAAAPTAKPREDPDDLAPPIPPIGPRCDAEIPRKIHLEVPNPDTDVRFEYQELFWNPPLLDGTFELSPTPGLAVEEVSCD